MPEHCVWARGSLGNTAISVASGATFSAGAGATAGSTAIAGQGASLLLSAGSTFSTVDNAIGTFRLDQEATFGSPGLTVSGATLDFEVGPIGADALAVGQTASVSGANTINVTPIGLALANGTYNLISAASGLTGAFRFANNSTSEQITIGSATYTLSLANSDTAERLTVSGGVTFPAAAYWTGALSGSWNAGGAGSASNWSSDAAGMTDTLQAPGPATNVTFTAGSAANFASTTLDTDFTINSLTFSGAGASATAAVGIGGANVLTINADASNGNTVGNGITVESGSGGPTISTAGIVLGASQTWTNNSANPLTVSAPISGAFDLATAGSGDFVLDGDNSFGNLTVGGSGFVTLGGNNSFANLTVAATGIAILTGANSYSATTIDSGGTLRVGNGGINGTLGTGPVSNDGSLVFNRSDAITLTTANAISGAGSVTIEGGGTVIFPNLPQTYTGGTTVDSGTLALTNGGTGVGAIRGVLTINSGGLVALRGPGDVFGYNDQATTLSTLNINGGTLDIQNSPGESLTGVTINFTGGTMMSSIGARYDFFDHGYGSVTVNTFASSDTASISTPIRFRQQDSVFTIAAGTTPSGIDFELSGPVSEVVVVGANLTKDGPGVMALSGANSYTGATTIDEGTLMIGAGATSGTLGTGGVLNNAALVFNRSDALSVGGAINGSGAVTQIGTGTTTLAAEDNYSGATAINAGGLAIDGSLTSTVSVTVNDTGTLSGIGTISAPVVLTGGSTGSTLRSSGTLSLNNTLDVGGNHNLLASGAISVAGATTIHAGGTLAVNGTLGGAGATTVAGTLRGTGTVSQAVTLAAGGTIAGSSGSTLTLSGGLTLADGSLSSFALNTSGANDGISMVIVTGGLNAPSGTPHTINFTGNAMFGTYELYSYDTGTPLLDQFVLGTLPGGNDNFELKIENNQIDLAVSPPGNSATWNLNGDGSYSQASNWSPTQIPNGAGLTATFADGDTNAVTAPAVRVAIDGALTIGSLVFANSNGTDYSLGSDGIASHGITLDNQGNGATITLGAGGNAHPTTTIFANLTLADNATFNVAPGNTLLISQSGGSASIAESGGSHGITLTGGGDLTIDRASSYSGTTRVSNGTLTVTATGVIGAGPLEIDGLGGNTSLADLQNSQAVASLSGTVSASGSARVNVAAGTSLTVSPAAGSSTYGGTLDLVTGAPGGKLIKSGAGTQVLSTAPILESGSSLEVSGGTLRIAATTGAASVGGNVTANVSGGNTLELAGSVSALGTATVADRVEHFHRFRRRHAPRLRRQSASRRDRRQRDGASERRNEPHGQSHQGRLAGDRRRCGELRDGDDRRFGYGRQPDRDERLRPGRLARGQRSGSGRQCERLEPPRHRRGIDAGASPSLSAPATGALGGSARSRARTFDAALVRPGNRGLPAGIAVQTGIHPPPCLTTTDNRQTTNNGQRTTTSGDGVEAAAATTCPADRHHRWPAGFFMRTAALVSGQFGEILRGSPSRVCGLRCDPSSLSGSGREF